MDEALDTIRRGAMTGIFPEGRVGRGELQRGRSGVTRLALAAGAPVVPVGIWGTQFRYPVEGLHWRRPWRPPLVLAFGEPISADGDVADAAQVRAFTKVVMDAIAEQLEIAQRVAASMR
jgi:1-acyl-sn-glycerol-3-phosphate acyltransferase